MSNQTLADEWDDYFANVLSRNPDVTPEMAGPLRMVFFSGATAMFVLLARCSTPSALRAEIEEHAASLGRAGFLQ
jgi:hypothetical protein